MWLFSRRARDGSLDGDISEAVRFAAKEWAAFREETEIPSNLGLQVQLGQFSIDFKPKLAKRFRSLRRAPPQLQLLIIAEGVAASGSVSRSAIERQLGITLPERPIVEGG